MSTEKNKRTRANGEGTIFKNRNRWVVACYDIHSIRRTKSFKKKIEAETWLVEQVNLRKRHRGSFVLDPKQTVAEYLPIWLHSIRHEIRPNTRRHYESTIRNLIVPDVGQIPASQLASPIVRELIKNLADRGYGHGSIIGVLRTLSAAYNWGRDDFRQIHNPVEGVKMLAIEPKVSKAVPLSDLASLYETANKSAFDLARLMIGAEIGLRPSEIMGLKWEDFSEMDRTLKVERQVQRETGKPLYFAPTKTGLRSCVPLSDRQVSILVSHRRYQALNKAAWKDDLGVIFPNSVGRLRDETLDKAWLRDLCRRANTPHYTRYQLRKSAFTNFLRGSDLGTTKAFSGHTSTRTLEDHYITPEIRAVREGVNRAEDELLEQFKRHRSLG